MYIGFCSGDVLVVEIYCSSFSCISKTTKNNMKGQLGQLISNVLVILIIVIILKYILRK